MRAHLPFEVNVPSRCYLDYALPLSVVASLPAWKELFYSYSIQLFFPDSLLGAAHSGLNKMMMCPGLNNWQWMELGALCVKRDDVFASSNATPKDLLEYLRAAIASNEYVEARLDEYWLESRPHFYRKKHALHINLIVGERRETNSFVVAGYADAYRLSEITESDIVKAFFASTDNNLCPSTDAVSYDRVVWKWRVLQLRPSPIDRQLVKEQLRDYLNGTSSLRHRVIATDDVLAYPADTGTWGAKTYAHWRRYLGRVRTGVSNLDVRATRTVFEHKYCMLQRAKLLESSQTSESTLLADLEELVELAKLFRIVAVQWNRFRQAASLAQLEELLNRLESLELPLLERLERVI